MEISGKNRNITTSHPIKISTFLLSYLLIEKIKILKKVDPLNKII